MNILYPYLVDQNVSSAICLFFLFGLSPGSYTEKLLLGKYDDAVHSAHPHLMCPGNGDGKRTSHDYTVEFVDSLPKQFRLSNYNDWKGFFYMDAKIRDEIFDYLEMAQVEALISGDRSSIGNIVASWITWGKKYGNGND